MWNRRDSLAACLAVTSLALVPAGVLLRAGAEPAAAAPEAARAIGRAGPSPAADAFMFTGPGSCSAAACHGSVQPRPGRIRQTEYTTWIVQDRHARAFEVLSSPVSVRMARILGLPRADTAPACLACHALDAPQDRRARTFTASEGVSCESCHGPASEWLGPHTTRDWSRARATRLGMYDTKDLVTRTEICLSCHLGTADRFVDHEMIAAGHPDLIFDLEAFTAAMPRHWAEGRDADPWIGVRSWSTGQIVELREGLRRLARRAEGPVWPEYAELDCFSCHHGLTRPEASWRQAQGYEGRRPGAPPWNPSRFAVSRHVARLVDAGAAAQLERDLAGIAAAMGRPDGGNRAEIAAAAARAADRVDRLVRPTADHRFDQAATQTLLRGIVADADRIAAEGVRSAEQAAMALESLLTAWRAAAPPASDAEIQAALSALFRHLDDPSAFTPGPFAAQMKRLGALVK